MMMREESVWLEYGIECECVVNHSSQIYPLYLEI